MRNCLDIVEPLVVVSEQRGFDRLQLFGGIGSYALTLATAEVHPDEETITVNEEVFLSQYREDGNLRDLDCLVLTTDDDIVESVERLAEQVTEKQLILSFFGLRKLSQLCEQTEHPVKSSLKVFVADRYASESANGIETAKKALFPFAVEMDIASLQTWQLQIPGRHPLPIPHPGTTVLNYLTRSVSGLRPKDHAKVEKLTHNLASKMPTIKDWLLDGPGQSQFELARVLHSLRNLHTQEGPLQLTDWLTIKPYSLDELTGHEAIIVNGSDNTVRQALKFAGLKSQAVHFYEEHDKAVTWWQKHIEPKIGVILKNKN